MDHVPPLTLLIYLLFGMAKDGCIMFLFGVGHRPNEGYCLALPNELSIINHTNLVIPELLREKEIAMNCEFPTKVQEFMDFQARKADSQTVLTGFTK
jgi:hypothetical protein